MRRFMSWDSITRRCGITRIEEKLYWKEAWKETLRSPTRFEKVGKHPIISV